MGIGKKLGNHLTNMAGGNSEEPMSKQLAKEAVRSGKNAVKRKLARKLIVIFGPIVVTMIVILSSFGGILNVFDALKEAFEPDEVHLTYEQWVNDPALVRKALEDGKFTYDGTGFNLSDDDLIRILDHVIAYENSRREMKTISYNAQRFVKDGSVSNDVLKETTLYRSDTESEPRDNGTDMFQIRWQLVVALCAMSSSNHNEDWGALPPDTELKDDETNDYFLEDATIDGILQALDYKFEYYYNYFEHDKTHYSWRDLDSASFLLGPVVESEDPDTKDILITLDRIPINSPSRAYNCFTQYLYEYETYENLYPDYFIGSKVLKGRIYTVNPKAFEAKMKEYIPAFDWDWLLGNLLVMPECYDLYTEYKGYYEIWKGDGTYTSDIEECRVGKVILGELMVAHLDPDVDIEDPEAPAPEIPVDLEGRIFVLENDDEHFYIQVWGERGGKTNYDEEKNPNALHRLRNDTRYDLNVSDNLTLEEIQSMLDYIDSHWRAKEGCHITSCAEGLYRAQEEFGISVSGILAIAPHEGAITTDVGLRYNYFNITAGKGEPSFETTNTSHRWRDFRAEAVAAVAARGESNVTEEMLANEAMYIQVYDYFKYDLFERRLQRTYFDMIWKFCSPDPEKGGFDITTLGNCYCPPWEDSSFPWKEWNEVAGWANQSAKMRESLLAKIGRLDIIHK